MAETKDTIIKTYEFKLRTNKSFVEVCERELEHSRQIYSAALAERISGYRITGAPSVMPSNHAFLRTRSQ